MNSVIINRVKEESLYILKTGETVRELATIFGISKSTVHKDLHERLIDIDLSLYKKVDELLKYHKEIRHLRGGESTKQKYMQQK